jgi:hypothetical protein
MNDRTAAAQPIRAQNELHADHTSHAHRFLLEDRSDGCSSTLGLYRTDDVLRYGLEPVKGVSKTLTGYEICRTTWKVSKTSPKLPFGVSQKDEGLFFYFHVSEMFKCWSKLRFDQYSKWAYKIQKNQKKNEKPTQIVFFCHILTIQVDKQGVHTFKKIIYPMWYLKLYCMKSRVKRSGLGFETWKVSKPTQSFLLEWLRRIQACFKNVQMLVKVRFDQYSNEHKKIQKNQKNEKPAHIVFLCHILMIQDDKQGVHTFKQKIHLSIVIS